ncbi:MAG: tyrosine-type recombinase/integrase [Eubacteriales bacterium]
MAALTLKQMDLASYPFPVTEYVTYMTAVLNRSEQTVCEYLLDLRTFFRYLRATDLGMDPLREDLSELDFSMIGIERLRAVSTGCLYQFLFYIDQARGNKSQAKLRKRSSLKSYFRFLVVKKRYLDTDPAMHMEGPKLKKSLPKYLSLEESMRLLQAVRSDLSSKHRQRDYAMLTIFLNCGVRLSELVGINLTAIDRDFTAMRVTGKGDKERIVYLNDACRAALYEYLQRRLDQSPNKMNTKALFLSGRDQRISNKTVQAVVYKYLSRAGLGGRGFSVHKLRHTAATLMYQTGEVDVRVLKDILGHEQLNTTQIYTHLTDRNMQEAVDKNPLSHVGTERKKR